MISVICVLVIYYLITRWCTEISNPVSYCEDNGQWLPAMTKYITEIKIVHLLNYDNTYIQLYTIIPNSEHIIILFKMYIEILLDNEYLIIKKSR